MQKNWKGNLEILLLAISIGLMCLIVNLFSQILDELRKEPKEPEVYPQAFYKCGRSDKHDVYCPLTPRRLNGPKTLRTTRQEKQVSSL